MSRVAKVLGWPHWCPVCVQTVRCKHDAGCKANTACTTHWRRLAIEQSMETVPEEPVDPAYEAGVWPPKARRK